MLASCYFYRLSLAEEPPTNLLTFVYHKKAEDLGIRGRNGYRKFRNPTLQSNRDCSKRKERHSPTSIKAELPVIRGWQYTLLMEGSGALWSKMYASCIGWRFPSGRPQGQVAPSLLAAGQKRSGLRRQKFSMGDGLCRREDGGPSLDVCGRHYDGELGPSSFFSYFDNLQKAVD